MRCSKFTAGLVSGIVIGLLIAPAKGEETRKKLSETAAAWKERVDNLLGKEDKDLDELKSILENEATMLDAEVKNRLLRLIERSRKTFKSTQEETFV